MRTYDIFKRALDVTCSLIALIVLSPVLALIALVVLFSMGRPVLFTQTRPGKGGKPFKLYKFRTMRPHHVIPGPDPGYHPHHVIPGPDPGSREAESLASASSDIEIVASDAERLTAFGRFLRATSLDELPELFNIIRGDMSYVGPRPLLVEYLPLYSPEQARRHEVRPGLTGLAQVSGRNALDWPARFALDVEYVDKRSLVLDLRILLRTIVAVIKREGTEATPPFTGN